MASNLSPLLFSSFSLPYKSPPTFFFTFSSVQCLLKHIAARLMASKSRLGELSAESLEPTTTSYWPALVFLRHRRQFRRNLFHYHSVSRYPPQGFGKKLELVITVPTVKIVNKEISKPPGIVNIIHITQCIEITMARCGLAIITSWDLR